MKHIILLILLTLGVWGQEVGVPYVNKSLFDKDCNIFQHKAVANQENTLYTLSRQSNIITEWQLNPVKKAKTIGNIAEKIRQIWVSEDGEYLYYVLQHEPNFVYAYNLELNQSVGATNLGNGGCIPPKNRVIIMNKNQLITIADDNSLYRFDFESLSREKEIPASGVNSSFKISQDGTKLILLTQTNILFLNISNFQIEKIISAPVGSTFRFKSHLNYDDLYYETLENKTKTIKENRININTQKIEDLPLSYCDTHHDVLIPQGFHPTEKPNRLHGSKNFSFVTPILSENIIDIYKRGSEEKVVSIFQLDDENWLVITPDGYFDGSPEARKYLYMKTSLGESVPINDATYQKYKKDIKLKDLK